MQNPKRPSNSRIDAAEILLEWRAQGRLPHGGFAEGGSDSRTVLKLVYGVIRHERSLHWVISQTIRDRPLPRVRTLLSVGLYQILFADDIPVHAAVHETVTATSVLCGDRSTGLVNAVLRRVEEEKKWWLLRLAEQPMPIRYSHPDSLPARWRKFYGVKGVHSICQWNNLPATTYLMRFQSKCTAAELEQAWKEAGVRAEKLGRKCPGFYELEHGQRIFNLPGYTEGWFQVQDPATRLAVDLLELRPGLTVLDACAAPGGKALAAMDRMKGEGSITALEISPQRVTRMEENFQRIRFPGMHTVTADLMAWEPPSGQTFDRVLVDAPCSNTGVIRRKPDIRWRFSEEHLERFVDQQYRLLSRAAEFTRPDGRLVYSTCSLEEEENETLVNRWLRDHPEWRLVRSEKRNPFQTQTDGAYAAQLKQSP